MVFDEYTYEELLQKQQWKRKREIILKRDKNKCMLCQSTENLNVHHKYYVIGKLPWEYPSDSLYTLCQNCHYLFHEIFQTLVYSRDEGDNLQRMELTPCYRCNGVGRLPEYLHVQHGICFRCHGERFEELIDVGTEEELAKFIIDKFVYDVGSYYLTDEELDNMYKQTAKQYRYKVELIQPKDLENLMFLARNNHSKAQQSLGEYYLLINDYESSFQWFSYAILNGSTRSLCKVYDLIVEGQIDLTLRSRREWKQIVETSVDNLVDQHLKMRDGDLNNCNKVFFRVFAPYSERCKKLYQRILKDQRK